MQAPSPPRTSIPFHQVRLTDGLLAQRQDITRRITIPFALRQCEESHRLENFDRAADILRRRAEGDATAQHQPSTIYPFDDTDPYKAIEAASSAMATAPDDQVAAILADMIRRIAAAQETDGYLYTFRTMHPDAPAHPWVGTRRWEDESALSHELYNLGHLYEAATAYRAATGEGTLLAVALRSAELLWRTFGPEGRAIAPGHQVVELGLLQLFRTTGDDRWLVLAQRFLEARGRRLPTKDQADQEKNGPRPMQVNGVFANPADARSLTEDATYTQDHQPVLDQREAVGHAVRANYQYAAMAEVAALTGDARYQTAVIDLWDDVVQRKYALTGGVGPRHHGEAYGGAHDVPADGYYETCAAVAFVMWSHRMYLLTGAAKYLDALERTLFNGTLSGMSWSGDRFFYPNPLVYDGRSATNHGHAGRAPWFGCACCPPNLARMLASLGGYVAAVQGDRLDVGLYAACTITASVGGVSVRVRQITAYPADGRVALTVEAAAPVTFTLALRLPGWVQGHPVPGDLYAYDDPRPAPWSLSIDDAPQDIVPQEGWLLLRRPWGASTRVDLTMSMPVRTVHADPKVTDLRGQVAFERGPVVYAVEGIDQPTEILDEPVLTQAPPAEIPWSTEIPLPALRIATGTGGTLVATPYFAWNNRGLAPMRVWLVRAP